MTIQMNGDGHQCWYVDEFTPLLCTIVFAGGILRQALFEKISRFSYNRAIIIG